MFYILEEEHICELNSKGIVKNVIKAQPNLEEQEDITEDEYNVGYNM